MFPQKRGEFLALAQVGEADLVRWRDAGWLSSDHATTEYLDQPEQFEILFVRNIARSGLYADDIDRLLASLEKPYSYHPTQTAYSFAMGWVASPWPEAEDAHFETHLLDWVHKKLEEDPESEVLADLVREVISARVRCAREARDRGD